MKMAAPISWDDLNSLFSIVMCIDESMTIVHASETLRKCLPETSSRPTVASVFSALRPAAFSSFQDGLNSLDSLCLLKANNDKFAIRGQLLQTRYQGQKVLCFCGSPWLFWINSNAPDTPLGLSDFSAQDVQLDQLFFMSTEKKVVQDLESLNSDLQVAKQDLEQAQESQKQFFAQMSHEIRTPLNGVISALSLLEQGEPDSQQAQFVRLAQSSSNNLMEVINYVLSVSKLELSADGEYAAFSWSDLINSTVEIVKARAQEKSLTVVVELHSEIPKACYGTPDRLRQTVLNLLINAIKFTETGGVTIRVMPGRSSDDLSNLRVEVIDTGIGIESAALGHIFTPFWSSANKKTAGVEEGTGLGLDIVRRNVQSMGGEIQVDSSPGMGTTFWFELPVEIPPESEEAALIDQAAVELEVPVLGGKVLLVDDNETNLLLGSLILERMGLEVISADGGAKAVRLVKEEVFDLVLMDLSMPDIDGLEATRQIRTFMGKDQLPIVALTAHIDEAEKRACLDIGMDGYLTKPIVRDELARALVKWLPGKNTDESGEEGEMESGKTKSAAGKLVDMAVLDDLLKQIGRDNLQIVIDKVQVEAAQRWNELEIAKAQSDAPAVRRHVHSLSSIFRSVGLMAAGNSLGEVEECLRAGNEPTEGWVEDIVQVWIDSRESLNRVMVNL
ncbi:MAG: signal transduction histidine kinase/DNA-binding response OmpR family regulator [Halioglobus sp.]|jgi:signal transduction histidine kinase/DNA-binding response OmpR family regulator